MLTQGIYAVSTLYSAALGFSPGGKHYAATCSAGTGRDFIVIDGKKGQEYLGIDRVSFAPDSTRAIYIATNSQARQFVVVDDQEFGPYHNLVATDAADNGLIMSRNGGHHIFAYVDKPKERRSKPALFVDDKPVFPDPRQRQFPMLTFTPDSQHLIWKGWVSNRRGPDDNMLYIDGKETMKFRPSPFDNMPAAWHMGADDVLQFLTIDDDGSLIRYRITPSSGNGIQTLLAGAGNCRESKGIVSTFENKAFPGAYTKVEC